MDLEASITTADMTRQDRRVSAHRLRDHGRRDRDRAVFRLSVLRHAGDVLRAVRLRVQSPHRLRQPAVARACDVLRARQLRLRPCRQSVGIGAGLGDRGRRRRLGRPRFRHRSARHSLRRHLLRHDHRRFFPDGVFRLRRGAVHPWRGRHPGGAARTGARLHRFVQSLDPLLLRRGGLSVRLSCRAARGQFAVRRDSRRRSEKTSPAPFRSATARSSTSSRPLSCPQ